MLALMKQEAGSVGSCARGRGMHGALVVLFLEKTNTKILILLTQTTKLNVKAMYFKHLIHPCRVMMI